MEVTPGVYQIRVKLANVVLLIEDGITLIDTGWRGSSGSLLDPVLHPDDLGDLLSRQQVHPVQIGTQGFPLPDGLINSLLLQGLGGLHLRDETQINGDLAEQLVLGISGDDVRQPGMIRDYG